MAIVALVSGKKAKISWKNKGQKVTKECPRGNPSIHTYILVAGPVLFTGHSLFLDWPCCSITTSDNRTTMNHEPEELKKDEKNDRIANS